MWQLTSPGVTKLAPSAQYFHRSQHSPAVTACGSIKAVRHNHENHSPTQALGSTRTFPRLTTPQDVLMTRSGWDWGTWKPMWTKGCWSQSTGTVSAPSKLTKYSRSRSRRTSKPTTPLRSRLWKQLTDTARSQPTNRHKRKAKHIHDLKRPKSALQETNEVATDETATVYSPP